MFDCEPIRRASPRQVNAVLDVSAAASDEASRAVQELEDELQRLQRDPHFEAAAQRKRSLTECRLS